LGNSSGFAFLPALLAYLFGQAVRIWIRPLVRLDPSSREWIEKLLHSHWYDYFLNAANAVSFVEGAVYWLLSAFLFAAVAGKVLGDQVDARPLSDAYTTARQRIGPIFVVSLVSWTCYMACRLVASRAVWTIIDQFHLGAISGTVLFVLPSVLICGLLSRMGLAIPWLIDDPASSFSSAVRNSFRKTENWEPFFMLFVIKSAIAAYALYWLANQGLGWLWQRGILTPGLDPWVTQLVYISLAAALETPLFIAFSILYGETTVREEESVSAAAVG
jgi:hypothetical protein